MSSPYLKIVLSFHFPVNQYCKGSYHKHVVKTMEDAVLLKKKYLLLKSETLTLVEERYSVVSGKMVVEEIHYRSTALFRDDFGFIIVMKLEGTVPGCLRIIPEGYRVQYTGGSSYQFVDTDGNLPTYKFNHIDPMSWPD